MLFIIFPALVANCVLYGTQWRHILHPAALEYSVDIMFLHIKQTIYLRRLANEYCYKRIITNIRKKSN